MKTIINIDQLGLNLRYLFFLWIRYLPIIQINLMTSSNFLLSETSEWERTLLMEVLYSWWNTGNIGNLLFEVRIIYNKNKSRINVQYIPLPLTERAEWRSTMIKN